MIRVKIKMAFHVIVIKHKYIYTSAEDSTVRLELQEKSLRSPEQIKMNLQKSDLTIRIEKHRQTSHMFRIKFLS